MDCWLKVLKLSYVYWFSFQVSTQLTRSSEIGNANPAVFGYFSSLGYKVQVSPSNLYILLGFCSQPRRAIHSPFGEETRDPSQHGSSKSGPKLKHECKIKLNLLIF